eukprot:1158034-Prymnesium_polylepis.1
MRVRRQVGCRETARVGPERRWAVEAARRSSGHRHVEWCESGGRIGGSSGSAKRARARGACAHGDVRRAATRSGTQGRRDDG